MPAKAILASADGGGVRPKSWRLGILPDTLPVWRLRYCAQGLAGLHTRPLAGRHSPSARKIAHRLPGTPLAEAMWIAIEESPNALGTK